jgi:hypothetical protein
MVCDDGRPDEATTTAESGTYTVDPAGVVHLVSTSTPTGSTHHTWALLSGDSLDVYRQEVSSSFGTSVSAERLLFIAAR